LASYNNKFITDQAQFRCNSTKKQHWHKKKVTNVQNINQRNKSQIYTKLVTKLLRVQHVAQCTRFQ